VRRWLFADQLGPHFVDDDQPVLLVQSQDAFRRRRYHRRKAHLVLSALHHRAAELGARALLLQTRTYREALEQVGEPVEVVAPTTRAADAFVGRLPGVSVLPERGWALTRDEFAAWAGGRRRLRLEDYYRHVRRTFDVLLEPDGEPIGGRWSFDAGYWAFLARARPELAGNHRMAQPLRGLDRLRDLPALLAQEEARGTSPP
jgi:deoxyribodipyrimidine photolyase-related protein